MAVERKLPITEEAEWADGEEEVWTANESIPAEADDGKIHAADAGVVLAAISTIIAGADALAGLIGQLLNAIGSAIRRLAIGINNHTDKKLIKPKYYLFSGKIEAASLEVEGKRCGAVGASKTAGPVATGAVGVISYEIEGTPHRLAIMYSVPFDYTWYSNWFKLGIISKNTATNHDLYVDMYYDKGELTSGNAARADEGYAEWHVEKDGITYHLEGVMGNGGVATMNTSLKITKID